MAILEHLLEAAVMDEDVRLDRSCQETLWRTGKPSLRAALAAAKHLDPSLRGTVAAESAVQVRRAFLSRPDLTASEVEEAVRSERRTSVLLDVAAQTQSPDLLGVLSRKGGKKLQVTVALNPSAPDEVRLRAAEQVLSSPEDVARRLVRPMQILMAECVPARRYVLERAVSLDLIAIALPLLPVTDGIDVPAVLERLTRLAADNVPGTYRSSQLLASLAELRWLMAEPTKQLLAQLASDAERRNGHSYATTSLLRALRTSEADHETVYRRVSGTAAVCALSRDADELRDVAGRLSSSYGESTQSMFSLASTLALLENPAAPLGAMVAAFSRNSDQEMRRRLLLRARRSVRTDAVLISTSYEPESELMADVEVPAVVELAARDGHMSPLMVANLVATGRMTPAALNMIPLSALPADLPAPVLRMLTDQLGERIADVSWLSAALALSSEFEASFSELVELIDCV